MASQSNDVEHQSEPELRNGNHVSNGSHALKEARLQKGPVFQNGSGSLNESNLQNGSSSQNGRSPEAGNSQTQETNVHIPQPRRNEPSTEPRHSEQSTEPGRNEQPMDSSQSDQSTAVSSGVQFANAIRDLRDRAQFAIHNHKREHGLERNNYNRLIQDIKPIDEFATGYPKLAAYESSDDNFLMYKKFGWLSSRVLLRLQDELLILSEDLTALDEFDNEKDPMRLVSRRRDEALDTRRKDLLIDAEKKLNRYYEILLHAHHLSSMDKPSVRNQWSVYNAIHATGSQVQSESEWIGDRDDLVAVAPKQEHGIINVFVEECTQFISKRLAAFLFRTPDQRRRTGKEEVFLYSERRLDAVANAFITLIATFMLLTPICILALTHTQAILQLVVILLFTQFFGFCITVFTKARKHEVFAATAAYAAVLVVFLANNNPLSFGPSQAPTS